MDIQRQRDEYFGLGFIILRGAIPPALIERLRQQTDTAREIARRNGGPQAQRLQPVYRYEELDQQPFQEFTRLPALQEAVAAILGADHGVSQILGVLLEPAESPWCTAWHRDWRDNAQGVDPEAFSRALLNMGMFNQINAALYDDHSLWVVPGSHNREDTPEERAAFPSMPPPGPELADAKTDAERERACQEYVRSMPGAMQVNLAAGDIAFYRACCWHIGVYVPYGKRATLHDGFYGPDDLAWQDSVRRAREYASVAAQK